MKKENKPEIHCMDDLWQLPYEERLKYEIANEIGVFDKVVEKGWGSLSSKESGRIGGILAHKRKNKTDHA